MNTDVSLERLYESVKLVPRIGRRRDGELCVMSLVALLAHERHTDRPGTACPVICAFAIKINDGVDDATRQALKPFAPRMIGTRDGHRRKRAYLLANAMLRDVLPHLARERGARPGFALLRRLRIASPEFDRDELLTLSTLLRREAESLGLDRSTLAEFRYLLRACRRGNDGFIANNCATFLTNRARLAGSADQARWYRNKGIDLLDRLCDVGETPYQGASLAISRAVQEADRNRMTTVYKGITKRLFTQKKQHNTDFF